MPPHEPASDAPAPRGGASAQAITSHYDIGTDFYALWLDRTLTYTAACWDDAADLETAQVAKLDHYLDRVGLTAGASLLDVGCGWGSLIARAEGAHGLGRGVGLTLSPDQASVAEHRVGDSSEVILQDWESFQTDERFDAVVSLGAIEHFARPELSQADRVARYATFFEAVHGWLKPAGRLGLQAIAFDQASTEGEGPLVDFFQTEIFPESTLPRATELLAAAEPWFHLRELTCRGDDYARTCAAWRRRLLASEAEATALVGPEVVARFLRYLGAARIAFLRRDWTLTRSIFVARTRPRTASATPIGERHAR